MGSRLAGLIVLSACGSFGEAADGPDTTADGGGLPGDAGSDAGGDRADAGRDPSCPHTFCFAFELVPSVATPAPFDALFAEGSTGGITFASIPDGVSGKAMRMTMSAGSGNADYYYAKRFPSAPAPKRAAMEVALRIKNDVGSSRFQVASIGWGRMSADDPINEMQLFVVGTSLQLKIDSDNAAPAVDFMTGQMPLDTWVTATVVLTRGLQGDWVLSGTFKGGTVAAKQQTFTPVAGVDPVMEVQVGLPNRETADYTPSAVDFDDLWVDVD